MLVGVGAVGGALWLMAVVVGVFVGRGGGGGGGDVVVCVVLLRLFFQCCAIRDRLSDTVC